MQLAKWMWADASFIGHGVAKINPLRWSHTKSIEGILSDLEKIKNTQPANAGRPVTVQFQNDIDAPHQIGNELEKVYPNLDFAVSGLQEHLSVSLAVYLSSAEKLLLDDCTSESTCSSVVSVPLQSLRSYLTCESTLLARWMSDNIGLTIGLTKVVPQYRKLSTHNPFRWSEWRSLEETIESLRSYINTDSKEQPVTLQVSVKSPGRCEVNYRTMAQSAAEIITTLEDLRDMLAKNEDKEEEEEEEKEEEEETSFSKELLKDRADFVADVGQENAEDSYQKYVSSIMQENGGYIGVAVRFSSDEPHPYLRKGQEGIIQQFDRMSSFIVNWGLRSASVGMLQCTVLATADKRLHLADVSVDALLANLMTLVNAHLKKLSNDPRQTEGFERACNRCVQVYKNPGIGQQAAESGICHTLVEAMTRDRYRLAGPTESVQSAGCIMLWWITVFNGYGGNNDVTASQIEQHRKALKVLKTKVVEANSFAALVAARNSFPKNQDLVRAAGDVVAFVIKDCQEFYSLALAAGWKEAWLPK